MSERAPTFGLFLNMGANLASTPEGVFDLTRRQARAADELGYHDLWVTEHHFIRFGLNPSPFAAAGFLLGMTERVRVGTAVVLSPLHHHVAVAEQASLLDQFSAGRFDLGVGRGGYVRDYDVYGIDTAAWDPEPELTLDAVLALWRGGPVHAAEPDVGIQPPVRAAGRPGLFVASSTEAAVKRAAVEGLALQHYFAVPVDGRVELEHRYRDAGGDPDAGHVHTLIVIVTDGDGTADRDRLRAALTQSLRDGDHPGVPNQADRHVGPDGQPLDRATMAEFVAAGAIVGPPSRVVDELGAFVDATGARRLVLYPESIGDASLTMGSIERFAAEVAPQLVGSRPTR
ncbi:MAG: LLM class flavin-dependent oxidoreductase [Desertimonas sp.]